MGSPPVLSRGILKRNDDYRVFVQNYRFHEPDAAPTPYRVEIEVNGKIKRFEGVISGKGETGPRSDIQIAEFVYDPSQRPQEDPQAAKQNPIVV